MKRRVSRDFIRCPQRMRNVRTKRIATREVGMIGASSSMPRWEANIRNADMPNNNPQGENQHTKRNDEKSGSKSSSGSGSKSESGGGSSSRSGSGSSSGSKSGGSSGKSGSKR